MGFLTRSAKDEEPDTSTNNEEMYERLFPKIGRDFVYKEDLKRILQDIMLLIDPLGLNPVDLDRNSAAKALAQEYKSIVESGKVNNQRFKDLIKIDEDDDDKKKKKDNKKEKKGKKNNSSTSGDLK